MEVSDSTFFLFTFSPPIIIIPLIPPPLVAAWLTSHLHHCQTRPGMAIPDVVNHFFQMASQCRSWREGRRKRERRGETRYDLVRLGDVFSSIQWQQDMSVHSFCSMVSSCLLCSSAAETSSTLFFPFHLWALLLSSSICCEMCILDLKKDQYLLFFLLQKLICQSIRTVWIGLKCAMVFWTGWGIWVELVLALP